MAQTTQITIDNQTFPSFRSKLNESLSALNTLNSGTSRPSSAVAGTIWLDITNATNPTLKFFDGNDDISLATFDYSANTVNWLDSTVVFDIVGDTTPQLGGDLDVNGNSLVSTSNGNITFTPNGTGKVVISGLSYPTADGTNGQALITDGSGNLSFGDVAGGTSWQSTIVTGTTLSAVSGNGYWINTTSNACTVTLPASPSVGDTIEFSDYARTWATNNVTINTNSLKFQGNASPNPVYDVNGQSVRIVYSGTTQGWIPTSDDDVTFETPQLYNVEYLVIAGGGGGGFDKGGGGGAGGYRASYNNESSGGGASSESTPYSVSAGDGTVFTVTVGGGGGGSTSGSLKGNNGVDSSVTDGTTAITSTGGGGGGTKAPNIDDGVSGGSGGGASTGVGAVGGSGTANQGFDGGDYLPDAGGGGGSGGAGSTDGVAGIGTASTITGSSVTRAGGGGGFNDPVAPGEAGGGDGGSEVPNSQATDATANTGSGGGGGNGASPSDGGDGGSGIVILRLPTSGYSGTTTGSPTVTTDGTDTILTFTGSGSYTN